ncbi:CaiB/BaiF CoA transferase family protein [Peribacillus glennii]|uniref:CaiB/BaiF CoA transferase family protein n=1 Tax=Peribacillus glennii TaxID=2303991 RepID=UPI0013148B38|nr:CaiB/BaiF CoA-transferase family protein [Peribacillus glennii]
MNNTVLGGLKILNLAEQYPGPYATLILSDLGADVINVERPIGGDPARQFDAFYQSINRNKRSLALDLKSEKGRQIFLELARDADVILEGYRPGVAKRLGISYEDISAINDRIVYASISGFGQDGPYKNRPAHDLSYQSIAGMLYRQVDSGQSFQVPKVETGDLSSGMFAAIGVLSGLFLRQQTGKGTYIDVSMTDGLVSWMTTNLVPFINKMGQPGLPAEPGYYIYKTQDGKLISISIAHEDWFWVDFCNEIGLSELTHLKSEERRTRFEELKQKVSQAISKHTRKEWEERFEKAGIPFGSVLSLEEVQHDPQFTQRGLFVEIPECNDRPAMTHVRQPLKFEGRETIPTKHAPHLGEHSRVILREIGYAEDEIDDLFSKNICYEELSKQHHS